MIQPNKYLVVISGPTGIGKTDLAFIIAQKFNAEIIGADSRQFYKDLKIGVSIPPEDYLKKIPHHFISFLSITDYYNAYKYERDVINFLENYFTKKNVALLVGGSGLYIDAVCKGIDDMPDCDFDLRNYLNKQYSIYGISWLRKLLYYYDPIIYNKVDLNNHKRLIRFIEVSILAKKPYSSIIKKTNKERNFKIIKIAINQNRTDLYNKIDKRVDEMIKNGLIEEAKSLYKFKDLLPLKTIGYQEIFSFIDGKISLSEAIDKIKFNTHKYAKKQISWLKRDKKYVWFDFNNFDDLIKNVENYLKKNLVF